MEKTQLTLMRNESPELEKFLKKFSETCFNKVKFPEELKSNLAVKGFCTFRSLLYSGPAPLSVFQFGIESPPPPPILVNLTAVMTQNK